MDQEPKQVGNAEGLSPIDHLHHMDNNLQGLQSRVDEMKKRFEEQEPFRSWKLNIRANKLERIASSSERETRNELAKGGSVKYDLKVLEYLEELRELDRLRKASIGFEVLYGLSSDQIVPNISTAPEKIVDILNRRGILKEVKMWRVWCLDGRDSWISACDRIISTWLSSPALCLGDEDQEEYNTLCQWMTDQNNAFERVMGGIRLR
jgi:hypothetical protein